jgi:predicted ester cyclase
MPCAGRTKASSSEIPASGKTISVQAMNFYYLADGKIIKERGQPDLLGVMQQIGAVPAP